MNIDLELYKTFYIVAKHKHMTKASEELHISQPAISQSIKKLEEQLDGTLFLRSNKGMELTEEGKMFFEYVKGALELIDNAEKEFTSFKTLDKGEIKIGCSTTLTKLILMDSIEKFHQDFPNININITNELTSKLIKDLKMGKLDFVIFNESNIKESNVSLKKSKKSTRLLLPEAFAPYTTACFNSLVLLLTFILWFGFARIFNDETIVSSVCLSNDLKFSTTILVSIDAMLLLI